MSKPQKLLYITWLHQLTTYLYKYKIFLVASPHLEGKIKSLYDEGLTVEQAGEKIIGEDKN